MPVSVNRQLGSKDRCHPDGAVISAFLSAVIDGDKICDWLETSAFSVQEVQADGSLTGLDFRAAALALHANEMDVIAKQSGAVGITSSSRRVAFANKTPADLRWNYAKLHSSEQRYKYSTDFKAIPSRAFFCWTADTG
jgi:hypothetical protein